MPVVAMPRARMRLSSKQLKRAALLLSCVPALLMAVSAATGGAGANPIEWLERTSGVWALRLLILALAVTPLRLLTGWAAVAGCRRTFGLAAFWYAAGHMLTWVVLDQALVLADIWADIVKRPYITIGMGAFLILSALAATSPRSMVKRLGSQRWQMLHKLVFLAATLGCVHYEMLLKGLQLPPFYYGGVLLALIGVRVAWSARRRASPSRVAA